MANLNSPVNLAYMCFDYGGEKKEEKVHFPISPEVVLSGTFLGC